MNSEVHPLKYVKSAEPKRNARWIGALPWIVLVVIFVSVAVAYQVNDQFRSAMNELWDVLSSGDQDQIRAYLKDFGAWAPAVSIALMTLQAVFAPIPASVVQLSNGVVFGIAGGALLNIVGQMMGATLAFVISRSLGRSAAERLAGRIDEHGVIEHWLAAWGARALFVVRVVPGMPSDFVSYLMGLTRMSARKFLLVSLLGYIPQSIAYSWLGDQTSGYFWWIVAAGFGISGIIGIVLWAVQRFRLRNAPAKLSMKSQRDSL